MGTEVKVVKVYISSCHLCGKQFEHKYRTKKFCSDECCHKNISMINKRPPNPNSLAKIPRKKFDRSLFCWRDRVRCSHYDECLNDRIATGNSSRYLSDPVNCYNGGVSDNS